MLDVGDGMTRTSTRLTFSYGRATIFLEKEKQPLNPWFSGM
jgi:hypothetical protein